MGSRGRIRFHSLFIGALTEGYEQRKPGGGRILLLVSWSLHCTSSSLRLFAPAQSLLFFADIPNCRLLLTVQRSEILYSLHRASDNPTSCRRNGLRVRCNNPYRSHPARAPADPNCFRCTGTSLAVEDDVSYLADPMRPDSHSGHDKGDDAPGAAPAESGRESKSEVNKPRGCRQAALGQDIGSGMSVCFSS